MVFWRVVKGLEVEEEKFGWKLSPHSGAGEPIELQRNGMCSLPQSRASKLQRREAVKKYSSPMKERLASVFRLAQRSPF